MLVLIAGHWQCGAWRIRCQAHGDGAGRAARGEPGPFTKVAVTGTLPHDRSALYGAEVRRHRDGPDGRALIVPLTATDGAAAAGRSRLGAAEACASRSRMPQGDVTMSGYVRPADTPGWFSAPDDVAGRQFYTLDPAAIGAALGDRVAPFTLVALGPPPPERFPIPARAPAAAAEQPLSYAITWYGLAVALLVIFVVWARKVFAHDEPRMRHLPPMIGCAARFARIATIGEAASVLGWDAAAMMPPGGGGGARRPARGAGRAGARAADRARGRPTTWRRPRPPAPTGSVARRQSAR